LVINSLYLHFHGLSPEQNKKGSKYKELLVDWGDLNPHSGGDITRKPFFSVVAGKCNNIVEIFSAPLVLKCIVLSELPPGYRRHQGVAYKAMESCANRAADSGMVRLS